MPKNIKKRGTAFENRTKRMLQECGWDVFRSAGSRSPADLVAFKPARILFVQCKAYEDPSLTEAEASGLLTLRRRTGGEILIIGRNNTNHRFIFYRMRANRDIVETEPKL